MPASLLALLLALMLLPGRAAAFSTEAHTALTKQATSEMGYDAAAGADILDGNLATDKHNSEGGEFETPAAHFDNETFSAGAARMRARLQAGLDALVACDPAEARRQVGRALHPLQDFFAHSNWIENHKLDDAVDLLSLKDPPPGVVCDRDTHKGPLTSGYWPDDKRPSPEKCVHAELNKDRPDRPGYEAARSRALAESQALLALFDRAVQARFTPAGAGEAAFRLRLLKDSTPALRGTCTPNPSAGAAFKTELPPNLATFFGR